MTSTTPLSGTLVTTYEYDNANRLTDRAVSDGRVYSYTWSARGQGTAPDLGADEWFAIPLTVTATSPTSNGLVIARNGIISVTFSRAVNHDTVNTRTFTVRGRQTGVYEGNYTFGSVQFDAADDFKPGEEIVAGLSSGLRAADGGPLTPHTWQFRAAAGSGSGLFADSGQSLGSAHSQAVTLGDVDGDGDLDAFVGNDSIDSQWIVGVGNEVWLNDGRGVFSDSGQSLGSLDTVAVALGDLDGDGDLAVRTATPSPWETWTAMATSMPSSPTARSPTRCG